MLAFSRIQPTQGAWTVQANSKKADDRQPDKRKQSLYFPEEMLSEIKREALRQDRSLSWIVQQAWRIARDEIKKFPSINLDTDVVED
ncbi:MAG: hypothetical protein DRI34_12650 [Deltaproteobacteria bacterium]|nr:MAG: hypothetical protein DRI34_12650 [Deltaproteobacteria bacterium]